MKLLEPLRPTLFSANSSTIWHINGSQSDDYQNVVIALGGAGNEIFKPGAVVQNIEV
jgi:hypothetical protein